MKKDKNEVNDELELSSETLKEIEEAAKASIINDLKKELENKEIIGEIKLYEIGNH